MVELIEYVMVVGISAGLAGASILVVEGAIPGLAGLASASTYDQIAGAAKLSVVEGGNATLLVPLHDASITCSSGSLAVSDGGGSRSYLIGYPCAFELSGLTGACTLVFSSQGSLELEATC